MGFQQGLGDCSAQSRVGEGTAPCHPSASHKPWVTLGTAPLGGTCTLRGASTVLGTGLGTCRIWSPSWMPWLSAGLPSCTPDTKMPTSFPPASRSPTLLAFTNCTILVSGLYLPWGRLQ